MKVLPLRDRLDISAEDPVSLQPLQPVFSNEPSSSTKIPHAPNSLPGFPCSGTLSYTDLGDPDQRCRHCFRKLGLLCIFIHQGSCGTFFHEFYWGMELYPRIGKNFDIKVFTNCRFGMMSWAVVAVTYCINQYETNGCLLMIEVGSWLLECLPPGTGDTGRLIATRFHTESYQGCTKTEICNLNFSMYLYLYGV